MTLMSPDGDLITAYAGEGSEAAFRALVSRHVNLVYATALRQVGDRGAAEEIAQNVFVALARKAPRLRGSETLAGWLHRAAMLEAKARIRADLRRKQREETAARIAVDEREGASLLQALEPLLDEALMDLRENDRVALLLRYFEERSLREVGAVLGMDEDAARKRVSRALDRLADFFKRRGFAVRAGGGVAVLMTQAGQAAPAGLAASAGSAGLAAGAAAGGIQLLAIQLMAFTKTQTAVACALVAAAPLVWQWRAEAHVVRRQAEFASQIAGANLQAEELEREAQRRREALARLRSETLNAGSRLERIQAQIAGREPRPVYRWDDASPLVRLPKALFEGIPVPAMANKRGDLSEQIQEILQFTPEESVAVRGAMERLLAGYHAAQAAQVRLVPPEPGDLNGREPEEVRVFAMPDVTAAVRDLRERLAAELGDALGEDRARLFYENLRDWMPLDDGYHGMNSAAAILPFEHQIRAYRTLDQLGDGEARISWGVGRLSGGGIWGKIPAGDIPPFLRPHLHDWIAEAQSEALAAANRVQPPTQ